MFSAKYRDELTIVSHGLPERRANTEHNTREYVLETGYQEESRIFRILYIGLLGIQLRRNEPLYSLAKHSGLWDA